MARVKNRLKVQMVLIFVATLIAFQMRAVAASQVDESGPSNGTDYVKVLFADAQYELLRLLVPLEAKNVGGLEVDSNVRVWLLESADGGVRFERLKTYLRVMELKFQRGPCSDGSGKPASICFFRDSAFGPYVLISLDDNKMTSKEQAMAMLLHEAGHFTGERDHLFLDRVGVRMVNALKAPGLFIADAQSTEIVPNIFLAKDECERGASQQARILRQQTATDILRQCDARHASCDLKKVQYIYKGTIDYEQGSGFSMKVMCAVRAVLDLRSSP